MSIIINSKKYEIPNIKTLSWLDGDPKIKYVTDKTKREKRIRGIVCHTHEGLRGKLLPGTGPNTTLDERLVMYQTNTDRYVSWDYTIDQNGDITCQNDPVIDYTWQGNMTNGYTLGFEMVQKINPDKTGDLFEKEVESTVQLIDFLTLALGIQRQIPWDSVKNKPASKVITRMETGKDVVGIYGHRNITEKRGEGDPGDAIFYALKNAGYECFDYGKDEDKTVWKQRQATLGLSTEDQDGIPLDKTLNAIKTKTDKKFGIWIPRPIDGMIKIL